MYQVVRGQKLENLLSYHEAQFISWHILCAPLVVMHNVISEKNHERFSNVLTPMILNERTSSASTYT